MGAISSGSSTSTTDYQRPEPGVYAARCIQVAELGTHIKTFNNEQKEVAEIMITWELNELMEDGRPFVVNWRGTNSLSTKAHLYKLLCSWRGKKFTDEEIAGFEMKNILDKTCMISLIKVTTKKGKDIVVVDSAMPLIKGMPVAPRVNDLVDFGINDYGTAEFEKLWPWVQDIVKDSLEIKTGLPPQSTQETPNEDDEIPF